MKGVWHGEHKHLLYYTVYFFKNQNSKLLTSKIYVFYVHCLENAALFKTIVSSISSSPSHHSPYPQLHLEHKSQHFQPPANSAGKQTKSKVIYVTSKLRQKQALPNSSSLSSPIVATLNVPIEMAPRRKQTGSLSDSGRNDPSELTDLQWIWGEQ